MRYSILHKGAPIGHVYLTRGELGVGSFEPYAAYESLRDLIRAASRSLWDVGFFASGVPTVAHARVSADALSRAAELDLELRDPKGALVPTDFVNIVERPESALPPVVFVRFRLAGSGKPAASPKAPLIGGAQEDET